MRLEPAFNLHTMLHSLVGVQRTLGSMLSELKSFAQRIARNFRFTASEIHSAQARVQAHAQRFQDAMTQLHDSSRRAAYRPEAFTADTLFTGERARAAAFGSRPQATYSFRAQPEAPFVPRTPYSDRPTFTNAGGAHNPPPRPNPPRQPGASAGPQARQQAGEGPGPQPCAQPGPHAQPPGAAHRRPNAGTAPEANAAPNASHRTSATTRPPPASVPTVPDGYTPADCQQMEAILATLGLKPADLYRLDQDDTWTRVRQTANRLLLKNHPDKLTHASASEDTLRVGKANTVFLNKSKTQLGEFREALIKHRASTAG